MPVLKRPPLHPVPPTQTERHRAVAQSNLDAVHGWWLTTHGRDGIDGAGARAKLVVDAMLQNAGADADTNTVTLGRMSDKVWFTDWKAVVAHEYAHLVLNAESREHRADGQEWFWDRRSELVDQRARAWDKGQEKVAHRINRKLDLLDARMAGNQAIHEALADGFGAAQYHTWGHAGRNAAKRKNIMTDYRMFLKNPPSERIDRGAREPHYSSGIVSTVLVALQKRYGWDELGRVQYDAINDTRFDRTTSFVQFADILADAAERRLGAEGRSIVEREFRRNHVPVKP
jgi:hypothetical protein